MPNYWAVILWIPFNNGAQLPREEVFMNKNISRQRGFTLIEIMVVVVVIGLLVAMLAPTVFNKVGQAEQTRISQDLRVIEGALKFYRLDNYRYPTQQQGLQALVNQPAGAERWNGPYLEQLPSDPWGVPYRYRIPAQQAREFDIYTLGADDAPGGEGGDRDIGNWQTP